MPQYDTRRLRVRTLALWTLLLCLFVPGPAAAEQVLKVGLLPTLSPRALITQYQPLRDYLERELNRPVVLHTAPDFAAHHRETENGTYDLVLTAAHLARLAQLEGRLQPLATYRGTNRPILVMAKARPVKTIAELRGRRLAIFDPMALVILHSLRWLEEQGLQAGRDFQVVDTPSHNSVAHAVATGEAILGVTAPAGMRSLPDELRDKLANYAELPPVSALIWAAHPRLGPEVPRLKALLLRFPESAEGRGFLSHTRYQGLREVSAEELRSLDPYAREVGRLLRAQP